MPIHDLQLMKGDGILRTEEFRKAIAEAKAHAYEVVGREHIKGERHERVRHFCITLRRRLGWHFDKKEISRLCVCQLFVWDDAGVLARNPRIPCDTSLLETSIMASQRYDHLYSKTEADQLIADMEELKRRVQSESAIATERMQRLSEEAGVINRQWDTLDKEIHELECN